MPMVPWWELLSIHSQMYFNIIWMHFWWPIEWCFILFTWLILISFRLIASYVTDILLSYIHLMISTLNLVLEAIILNLPFCSKRFFSINYSNFPRTFPKVRFYNWLFGTLFGSNSVVFLLFHALHYNFSLFLPNCDP